MKTNDMDAGAHQLGQHDLALEVGGARAFTAVKLLVASKFS